MVKRQRLMKYLTELLNPSQFRDYCPNGLQVEGCDVIKKLVTGVSACQALLDQAISAKADAVLVHHGYFWRGEDECVVGVKKNRLQTLLKANTNLLAYHLPLDGHSDYGNNVQLAKRLNISITGDMGLSGGQGVGLLGELLQPMTAIDFSGHIESTLNRPPLLISDQPKNLIKTIAWCSGAAQDAIIKASSLGVDAYLTGEVSERTFHLAKELKVHFYAAGHHATERYGVLALGNHLAEKFALDCQFIDIDNPV